MADAKDCPKCGLVNPPLAQRCDCGYDFVSRSVERSYLSHQAGRRPDAGARVVGYGCLAVAPLLLLGGAVTAAKALGAGGDAAAAFGQACGAFLPGLGALIVAAYLLRRGRGA